jgi:hypothetical protein
LALQFLQHLQAGCDFVRSRSRHPPPVLTNGPRQLQTAQPLAQPHGLPGRLQLLGRYPGAVPAGRPSLFQWRFQSVLFFQTLWKPRYCFKNDLGCLALFATNLFASPQPLSEWDWRQSPRATEPCDHDKPCKLGPSSDSPAPRPTKAERELRPLTRLRCSRTCAGVY